MPITQNPYTFTINKDFNISVISKVKEITVTIIQSSNQIIKVECDGNMYTSSFTVPYGTTYTATVTPNTGYDAGTISSSSGVITEDFTISVTPATIKYFTVTINQSANQIITVVCNEQVYTSSFKTSYGSIYTVKIVPNTGYIAGTLNTSGGIINSDIIINATNATSINDQYYTITIEQTPNQTITVTCNGTAYTSTFKAKYGTTYTAIVLPNSAAYNSGILNHVFGTINGDITISASSATKKMYTITIEQTPNQTITVICNEQKYTSTFLAEHGSTYTVDIKANLGYIAGNLNITNGTITDNVSIFASAASKGSEIDLSYYAQNYISAYQNVTEIPQTNISELLNISTNNTNHMFYYCSRLNSIPNLYINTSKVTDMSYMFAYCQSLIDLDISYIDTNNVITTNSMFKYCLKLKSLKTSSLNDFSKVKDMSYMFYNCYNLIHIDCIIDMTNCTNYSDMFFGCNSLSEVKIKNPPLGFNGAGLSSSQYTIVS